jgi:hypothetical protein
MPLRSPLVLLAAVLSAPVEGQSCYHRAALRGLDGGVSSPGHMQWEIDHGNSTTLAYLRTNQWVTLIAPGQVQPVPVPLRLCFTNGGVACLLHGEVLAFGWHGRMNVPAGFAGQRITLQMAGLDIGSGCLNTTWELSLLLR